MRLNEDEYAQLEEMADQQRLPVSTLARSFLLGALEPTATDEIRQAVDQLHAARDDVQAVVELLRNGEDHTKAS